MAKHLLDLTEFSKDEVRWLIETALKIKYTPREELLKYCPGKRAVILFEKPSTRTRLSLELAVAGLGGHPVVVSSGELQLSRGEDIKDTARVFSSYVDAVCARVFKHETLEEMARFSSVPVINALSDIHHPLQALADVLTLYEKKKSYDFTVAYVGDGNNVCHSLMVAASILGFKIKVATPSELKPDEAVVGSLSDKLNEVFEYYEDPFDAVKGADAVYTDTWVSMGFDEEREKRVKLLSDYQVNDELMKAAPGAFFMHCLPAHKGEEVTEGVFESSQSIVFEQAKNRLFTAMSVFLYFWKEVR